MSTLIEMPDFNQVTRAILASALAASTLGCDPLPACGPSTATVTRVVDGDTIEIDTGERVRYLLVDTPETFDGPECYGPEATLANKALVAGRQVNLKYDVECTDTYDRLLAFVEVDGVDVSASLIENGFGCVLHIPPNGESRIEAYLSLEDDAQAKGAGLWGSCREDLPCGI